MGPVLPCAVDKEIVFCINSVSSPHIKASNVNPDFDEIEFFFSYEVEPYKNGLNPSFEESKFY